jgi:hypothetical protein
MLAGVDNSVDEHHQGVANGEPNAQDQRADTTRRRPTIVLHSASHYIARFRLLERVGMHLGGGLLAAIPQDLLPPRSRGRQMRKLVPPICVLLTVRNVSTFSRRLVRDFVE